MSSSCIGTCSHCGTGRLWLSDTLSLQFDDGRLKCLPHPGERHACEAHGLTLAQASERRRLYRETFYVCRACGRDGVLIERADAEDPEPLTLSVRGAMKWGWGSAAIVIPLFAWLRWWNGVATVGFTLLASPAIAWWENRKEAKAIAAKGFPRLDAPGRAPIAAPTVGCRGHEFVVGRINKGDDGRRLPPSGPCCPRPEWIDAFSAREEDRIPCTSCGSGVMVISEHSIH